MSGDGEASSRPDRLGEVADADRLVRDVTTAVLDATDPAEIQVVFADALAASNRYSGVWVGDRLDPAATGAVGPDPLVTVLGEIATMPEDTEGFVPSDGVTVVPAPIVQAIAADAGENVSQVHVACVPLRYWDLASGTAVVASTRTGAFDAGERAALSEVGRLTGFALDAAVHRRLLAEGSAVEAVLETHHETVPTALTLLAGAADATVELDRSVPREDGAHLYVSVPTTDLSLESIADHDLVREATVRTRDEQRLTVELVVSDQCPLASLTASGLAVVAATADADRLRTTVRGGETGPTILRAFRQQFPSATCVAKRQVSNDESDRAAESLLTRAGLTRKQRTVLQAALAGGFFERPRDRTGAEIAASLDLSASTFHQHLREAIRKVVETAVESDT